MPPFVVLVAARENKRAENYCRPTRRRTVGLNAKCTLRRPWPRRRRWDGAAS